MTQEEIKQRALATIEGLCLLWENGPKTEERSAHILGGIYRYSHLAAGHCENPHADWLIEMNLMYESLIKGGLISRDS